MEKRAGRLVLAAHLVLAAAGLLGCSGGDGPPAGRTGDPGASAAGESAAGESVAGESAAGGSAGKPAPAAAVDPTLLHHGIDVSGHSGAVDWTRVAGAGHTFAVVKATEGVDLKDPGFDAHWETLRAAGLVRGAYHFYVTEDDPEEQARFFIDNVRLEPGDLAPIVDVELIGHGTEPGLPDRLRTYLERVEAQYGVKPIIYTAAKFWNQHLTGDFGDYPLWVAEYGVSEPALPKGWDRWHLWQWRGDAAVPGVEKDADLSRVNRDEVDLAELLIPGASGGGTAVGGPVPDSESET